MTLAFIALAISLAVETNRQSRWAIESTGAVRNAVIAEQMAAAGVHAAMAVLIQDRYDSETDHLEETWADPVKLKEALSTVTFEGGYLEVRIADEMARLQINALVDFPQSRSFNPDQRQIMIRLIEQVRQNLESQSDLSATDLVNAIKDWLDTGDDNAITGLNGAESDYYEALSPPYKARNGPIIHIADLARIKGVTPELFEGRNDIPGLREFMTAFGVGPAANGEFTFSGKINLNTASQEVIAALMPPESKDMAEALVQYRDEADAAVFESQTWYLDIPGAAGLASMTNSISQSSNIFRIQATANRDQFQHATSAVVERRIAAEGKGWTCRILSWEDS